MSASTGQPRRADASMTLLTEMLQRPLDPGYAAAARQRQARGLSRATGTHSVRFTVSLLVAGLLLGIAAATLGQTTTTRTQARADLIARIETGRTQAEAKSATIATLNARLAARDEAALKTQSGVQANTLRELSIVTGAAAVEGPGLVITIDDAPETGGAGSNSDPRTSSRSQDGIVRARDLQIIANGLWEAGAEAIMINGQRLTSTTAIRFAGEALIVNYRPLNRPYVLTAIGDPSSFPSAFANGAGGSYLAALKGSFGIQQHIATVSTATMPASSAVQTRVAVPLTPTGAAPTGAPTASASPSASGGAP